MLMCRTVAALERWNERLFPAALASLLVGLVAVGCGDGNSTEDTDAGNGQDTDTELPDDSTCGQQPSPPECSEVSEVPADDETVTEFLEDNAIPLKCFDGESDRWELDYLLSHIGDARLVVIGEIHGSNELGPFSAALFEALLEAEKVDAVAMEVGMDTQDAWDQYVETGSMDGLTFYDLDETSEVMFWSTLSSVARDHSIQGDAVPVYAVDLPWRLAWVNEQVEEIAEQASTDTAALILEGLPAPKEYLDDSIDGVYVEETEAYHQHLADSQGALSAELGELEADHLVQLAKALYLGAFLVSSDAESATGAQWQSWSMDRERLMVHNLKRTFLAHDHEAVYAHLGAAHAINGNSSAAEQMDEQFDVTQNAVYTLRPAYGADSSIRYGSEIQPLDPFPAEADAVLSDLEDDNYYLAAQSPGLDCAGNPVPYFTSELIPSQALSTKYDGLVWFRTLTPEPE